MSKAIGSLSFFADPMFLFLTRAHPSTSRSHRRRCDGISDSVDVTSPTVCLFLRLLRKCFSEIIDWIDPAVILKDYGASMSVNIAIDSHLVTVTFNQPNHAIAGIYM